MANCSIPSSTPATGRISTRSLRRLRRQNSASISVADTRLLRLFNGQRPTPNAQRSIHLVGRWMLDVERWAFSLWRVKGAWWPPRSSKTLRYLGKKSLLTFYCTQEAFRALTLDDRKTWERSV